MTRSLPTLVGAFALAFLAGCAGSAPLNQSAEPGIQPLPPSSGARVLTSADFTSPSETVLEAIAMNMPGVQIRTSGAACPSIGIRGPSTMPGVTEPSVYVNGAHAQSTCILESLPTSDVARVEVYPMGVTPRAGYDVNPHGLILIFLKQAGQ